MAMRALLPRKMWVAATVGVVTIGTVAAVALGSTPSLGFVATNLATAKLDNSVKFNSDRVKFQTKDPTYVRVQKVEFAAGSVSGWHHHPGIVIVAVLSGDVTFTNSDCSSNTYHAGDVFTEAGDDPGQASGGVNGAVAYATFVAPNNGSAPTYAGAFRVEDLAVSCPG